MAPQRPSNSADSYTVGWIAALPFERAAATALLDERHDQPRDFVQNRNDTNSYTWGKMNQHNVVIASLPAGVYGTTSAATTASKLLSSFPQIRIGLLVGIGGGVARPESGRDLRLGDVVVSQPQGTTGGVIQYDLGKAKPNGEWERKDSLAKPPQILLSALANLQTDHELGESQISIYLQVIAEKTSRVASKLKGGAFIHQGHENDRLFVSSYHHEASSNCEACDGTKLVDREERGFTDPEIHYGIIASGNTLVKDAVSRDKILRDIGEECLCLEMEAAGLIDHFPCVVIRGIADYADSHKNDRWQRYASATAAAYGKELLSYVPTQGLQETQTALEVLESINEGIRAVQSVTITTQDRVDKLVSDCHNEKIRRWLSPPDPSNNLNEAIRKRHSGTGSWFFKSEQFRNWNSGLHENLWIHGIPGAGKTVLSASIIENLTQKLDQSQDTPLLYFFFDFSNSAKQSLDGLVRSLVTQLYSKSEKARAHLDALFLSSGGYRQPTYESLFTTFQQMLRSLKNTRIVIDALDECMTRTELLRWMETLTGSENINYQLLFTSRKEEDIESSIKRWLRVDDICSIQQDAVNQDICAYVHERLRTDHGFKRWQEDSSVQREIESELMKHAGGMFRWAVCQLDILQDCLDLRMLRRSLRSLPKTLSETYGRILANIDEAYRDYAIRLLQFLTYSMRPFGLAEAVEIVAIDPTAEVPFDARLRMPEPRDLLRICPSLVSLVTRGFKSNIEELHLSHFSVQQYLKSDMIDMSFPQAQLDTGLLFQMSMSEVRARASIVTCCLAYLSCLHKDCLTRNVSHCFPLTYYAAGYWLDYARESVGDKELEQTILKFFLPQNEGYGTWTRLFEGHHLRYDREQHMPDEAPPIYFACFAGLHHIAQLLIDQGADVNAKGGDYGYPLVAASSEGRQDMVALLLDNGANIDAASCGPGTDDYGTALQAACMNGHMNVVELLLDRGANVQADQGQYGTPLHQASFNGHSEIVSLLLERGADINATTGIWWTALQAACYAGEQEVVHQLVERGATINTLGGEHGNGLIAACSEGLTEIAAFLLERGADINAENVQLGYVNALQVASGRGDIVTMRLLLGKGADVNPERSGDAIHTPLMSACDGGYREAARLLLENGADVNAKVELEGTALCVASYKGHEDIVQLLLEHGAGNDADIEDVLLNVLLHPASQRKNDREVMQLLLATGLDARAFIERHGDAIRDVEKRHEDLIQLLVEQASRRAL